MNLSTRVFWRRCELANEKDEIRGLVDDEDLDLPVGKEVKLGERPDPGLLETPER